jgi:hypothetical protein
MTTRPLQYAPQFQNWFNRNLKGETIYTADMPTLKRRVRQFARIKRLSESETIILGMEVTLLLATAEKRAVTA